VLTAIDKVAVMDVSRINPAANAPTIGARPMALASQERKKAEGEAHREQHATGTELKPPRTVWREVHAKHERANEKASRFAEQQGNLHTRERAHDPQR